MGPMILVTRRLGSGTAGYVSVWNTGGRSLGDSPIYNNNGLIGIGITTTASDKLHIVADGVTSLGITVKNTLVSSGAVLGLVNSGGFALNIYMTGASGAFGGSIRQSAGILYGSASGGIGINAVDAAGIITFVTGADSTANIRLTIGANGVMTYANRIAKKQGADVASANDLTLGVDGNSFEITAATQINAITIADWQNGSQVTLLFTSNPTVKHNTAGGAGTALILLAGAADFVASAGDTLTLLLSEIGGTQAWREISRTVI